MRSWPKSAYWTIAVLLVASAMALRWVYLETRSSYRAVGFNDGQIFERAQTMEKIRQLVTLSECSQLPTGTKPVEFLAVKADSIYALTSNDNHIQFCR